MTKAERRLLRDIASHVGIMRFDYSMMEFDRETKALETEAALAASAAAEADRWADADAQERAAPEAEAQGGGVR